MSGNPYPFNSESWRIWQQGADATNDKWRRALAGKLPAERKDKAA